MAGGGIASGSHRWAEVDLGALKANVALLRGLLPAATRFIAVVKANGYGHGAREVARAALEAGAWGLAVVTLAEAAEVRDLLPPERVLVLGPLLPEDAPEAVAGRHLLGCSSVVVARALEAAAGERRVPIHAKLDTGMGRYGADPEEFAALLSLIRASNRLELAGTWTHLASSDSDPSYTAEQLERFLAATEGLPGLRHVANSGAVLRHPEAALDAVRVGIALYGCGDPRLEPVLRLRARVAHLKTAPAGSSIGYGRTWTAGRRTRVATVTIGYADGVQRGRANRGVVLVRGRRAPLVGAVSMDSITLDVTEVPGVELGDAATLLGQDGEERILAEEAAEWSGTISYEVLTSIGTRVERHYSRR
ncbi:MAG: alanine racemase [Chloroflexi bacterium]|nr:MAG: alanine racemase [Chloroflexota bacterium]